MAADAPTAPRRRRSQERDENRQRKSARTTPRLTGIDMPSPKKLNLSPRTGGLVLSPKAMALFQVVDEKQDSQEGVQKLPTFELAPPALEPGKVRSPRDCEPPLQGRAQAAPFADSPAWRRESGPPPIKIGTQAAPPFADSPAWRGHSSGDGAQAAPFADSPAWRHKEGSVHLNILEDSRDATAEEDCGKDKPAPLSESVSPPQR